MFDRLFRARQQTAVGDDVGQLAMEALQNRAQATPGQASNLAVIEGAARIVGHALATATVDGTEILTPAIREMVGRQLIKSGEVLFLKSRNKGPLIPVASWDIRGEPAPDKWAYRLTINGPDTSQETRVEVMSDMVVHFRINCQPGSPWRGQPPWEGAELSAGTATNAEKSAGDSARVPSGALLPVPLAQGGKSTEQVKQAQAMTKAASQALAVSGLFVLPTPANKPGGGTMSGTSRIGPEPAQAHVQLRTDAQYALCWACGVPPVLMSYQAQGNTLREGWRQLQHGLMEPMARLIEGELSMKGFGGVMFNFKSLHASDLATRGRVLKQLVEAGVGLSDAREIAGL